MDCEWIGWCALEQSAQAAWAQAIFSVIGIGVAILVPFLQHRNAAKVRAIDSKQLAISRASGLIRHVKAYADRVDRTKNAFDQRDQNVDAWKLAWPAPSADLLAAAVALHELGQPGIDLIKAMHHSLEAKHLLDDGYYVNRDNVADYGRHVISAQTRVHASLRGMKALLES